MGGGPVITGPVREGDGSVVGLAPAVLTPTPLIFQQLLSFGERRLQQFDPQRPGQVAVPAGRLALFTLAIHGVRRERDDADWSGGYAGQTRVGRESLRGVVAI